VFSISIWSMAAGESGWKPRLREDVLGRRMLSVTDDLMVPRRCKNKKCLVLQQDTQFVVKCVCARLKHDVAKL
jgi:hypothetical protein